METESSNESLMDISAGPNHRFDISPLQGEEGEISRITQAVSAKMVYDNILKTEVPNKLLSLDVLRKQRDSVREQARVITEEIMQEERNI